MNQTFPTLYKQGENGNVIEWSVEAREVEAGTEAVRDVCGTPGVVITRWGQEGGQFQETRDIIAKGKNVGRKNETTPFQQACAEALSKWEKQQKARKYCTSRENALAGVRSDLVTGGVDPMLAHPMEDKLKHVVYPSLGQPKLDGHRCTAIFRNGQVTLWSRTRKPILSMPHIVAALEKQFAGYDGAPLDGELYNHDYHDNFEDLTGFITSDEPQEGHQLVQYHLYDIVDHDATAFDRHDKLAKLMESYVPERLGSFPDTLVLVETVAIHSAAEALRWRDDYMALNYEGLMLRNPASFYEGKRSNGLLKYKLFIDKEFLCTAVTAQSRISVDKTGKQVEVWYPVFTFLVEDGTTTNAPMMGKRHVVQKYADNPSLVIGKMLTVKFQGYTKEGALRFPKCRLYKAL